MVRSPRRPERLFGPATEITGTGYNSRNSYLTEGDQVSAIIAAFENSTNPREYQEDAIRNIYNEGAAK